MNLLRLLSMVMFRTLSLSTLSATCHFQEEPQVSQETDLDASFQVVTNFAALKLPH